MQNQFPLVPANEAERMSELKSLKLLDTLPEKEIDDLTFVASQVCDVPMAVVSLIDSDRQWFKSRFGIEAPQTSRDCAFCAFAILDKEIMVVEDALLDTRFKNNPLVLGEPKIRFYAGTQLCTSRGMNIGTLCVLDRKPRKLSENQLKSLKALGAQVISNFEKKRLSNELKTRESFLNTTLSMVPDLISYIDTNYTYRYVNNAYMPWFKMQLDQMLGKRVSEVVGEEAFSWIKVSLDKAFLGERQQFEYTLPYKVEGKIESKTVKSHIIPDIAENGKVLGTYNFISDISVLKKAEIQALQRSKELDEALSRAKESEAALRRIFENSPIGMIQLDSNLHFLSASPAFTKFIGYSEVELNTMLITDLIGSSERLADPLKDWLQGLLLSEVSMIEATQLKHLEIPLISKSLKVVWGLFSSQAVYNPETKDLVIIAAIEDLSEIKTLQASLDQERAKAFYSSKLASLGEMSAGMAHEINNPLTTAIATLEILEIVRDDPKKHAEKITLLKKACNRIKKITQGLSKFSRDGKKGSSSLHSLSEIANEILVLTEANAKQKHVAVTVENNLIALINCDEVEVGQVLINLVNNAIDAVKILPEKWVKIIFKEDKDHIRLQVMDSGSGIPEPVREKLFTPFFTTKKVGEGTGLGLSIVQGIMTEHGGTITLLTETPNTCFELVFPKANSPAK